MSESFSDINSELIIQDNLQVVQHVWDKVRPDSARTVEYPYCDEQHRFEKVNFWVEDNNKPSARFGFQTPTGEYMVLVKRENIFETGGDSQTTPTLTAVLKLNDSKHAYLPAKAEDKEQLALYMAQVDPDAIRVGYEASLLHRQQRKAPSIGATAIDAVKGYFGRPK